MARVKAPSPSKRRNIEYEKVALLGFDTENPRLPDDGSVDLTSDESILEFIERTYAVDELGTSLVDNGYFDSEPLLIVSKPKGRFRVVEGNRRLAALKLLLEPASRAGLTAPRRAVWDELAKQADKSRLTQVPVIKYSKRTELLDYLGFRHISGVKEWRPSAKARFLWNLMEGEKLDYRSAARRVGSTAPAVRRQVEAYAVLRQASERGLNAEPAERYFGLFYNALQDPGVRRYVGLGDIATVTKPVRNPITTTGRANLGNLLNLLFGDGDRRAVIRESREIRSLGGAPPVTTPNPPWDTAPFPEVTATQVEEICDRHDLGRLHLGTIPPSGVVNAIFALGPDLILRVSKDIPEAIRGTSPSRLLRPRRAALVFVHRD